MHWKVSPPNLPYNYKLHLILTLHSNWTKKCMNESELKSFLDAYTVAWVPASFIVLVLRWKSNPDDVFIATTLDMHTVGSCLHLCVCALGESTTMWLELKNFLNSLWVIFVHLLSIINSYEVHDMYSVCLISASYVYSIAGKLHLIQVQTLLSLFCQISSRNWW